MSRKAAFLLFINIIGVTILSCTAFPGSGDEVETFNTVGEPEILFEDDFSVASSGWDQYTGGEGYADYENGAYKIGVYTDTMLYWANPYRDFTDVVVEVDAQKVAGGDEMLYGIICRYADQDNWYALVISGQGWAAIRKRSQGSGLEYITDWMEASSINTGSNANQLRVECVGSRLSLYVNGFLAVETNDASISSGDAGLMVGTLDQPEAEVLFDNFVVRRP
jgi:hypothetical protein